MAEVLYPVLSYTLVGLLFKVHKRLGGSFEEKYYQRAVEKLLQAHGIRYQKELMANITFENDTIGKFFLDFLIDDKVVLELKTVPILLPIHYKQVRSYLKVKKLRLGILANFRGQSLVYKRILSPIDSH